MPATEAQIRANKANAQMSTGPKTEEGKSASRANSYKHGLTATKVLPELEAVEVQRRYASFWTELKPSGDVAACLTLRAATLSVRMERCVTHENAMLTERVRRAEADFVPPEGVDEAQAARLRTEAGKRALFDSSKEATLARKYEASAERGFLRALKELHQLKRAAKVAEEEAFEEKLGSILPGEMTDEEFDALEAGAASPSPRRPASPTARDVYAALKARIDVPIAVGKRR
jgi:hypothetical protein